MCAMQSEFLTTTLTTKGMHISAQYALWRTDYYMGLLSTHLGGQLSSGLENRSRLTALSRRPRFLDSPILGHWRLLPERRQYPRMRLYKSPPRRRARACPSRRRYLFDRK